MVLTPDVVTAATTASVEALTPYADADWHGVRARDLDWSCWTTAAHVVDDLHFYAVQLIQGAPEARYLPVEAAADPAGTVLGLLEAISVHGELLRRAVLGADPQDRGYHVYGVSDATGFAAMGAVETLVHTYDVVRALAPDDPWRPPAEQAAAVLERLFPDAPEGEPADVLLHCCGRESLGGSPRPATWRWDGTVRP